MGLSPLSLASLPIGNKSYVAITQANYQAIEDFCNALAAQVSALGGDGAQLILDTFDRDGIVGSASYQLDVPNYPGGAQIVIGRRPTPVTALGDQNISIAFGTYGGVRQRVTLNGDVTLNASGIVSGLPKTIYVGIPSDGTPQLYEDPALPNLIYAYSMCWNGFSLTQFHRMAHILPGFTLIQDLANAKETERVFDGATDFLYHEDSLSTIVLGGDGEESETGLNVSRQVLGGFISCQGGEDTFFCPAGPNKLLTLQLLDDQDRRWNLQDIVIDCSATPTRFFFTIDPALGDDVFVTDVAEFRLSKVSAGSSIVSARRFSWGLYTRPVIGTPIAQDQTKVDGI